ncbi:MAG TPA: DNA repair protein RecO [Candidatus Saccharimonadales bacterium]|nr:DNA repair protein RecO [Candidatus Saccharimonadales bacterium]
MYLRTEGIILRRRNFGEADRLITLYTKDFGKLTAIAKGVRRPRSKKAGHLELASHCKVFIAKGKNIDILTEVELKKAFGIDNLTEDKTNRIYHLLELIDVLTVENQKNVPIYNLLLEFLKHLQSEDNFQLISSIFKIKLMSQLGFFSSRNLKETKTREVLAILEDKEYEVVKSRLQLSEGSYLKLLSFLDSMIENVTSSKIKTARFV